MGNGLSTFSGSLRYVAEAYPYRPAISVRGGSELVYVDLHNSVEKDASVLISHGVKPRDVVLVVFSDDVEPVVRLLAVMRVRAVAVPILEPVRGDEDLEPYLLRCNPKFLVRGLESNPTVLFVRSLRNPPGDPAAARVIDVPGDISGVVNDPSDPALLLITTPGGAAYEKTQGELSSLLRSANQVTGSDPAEPLLHLRGHRHLASVFFLLEVAVKSLTNTTGEGGCRNDSKTEKSTTTTTEYSKLLELSLVCAISFLANLTKNLPVSPWSQRTAVLLFTRPFSCRQWAWLSTPG